MRALHSRSPCCLMPAPGPGALRNLLAWLGKGKAQGDAGHERSRDESRVAVFVVIHRILAATPSCLFLGRRDMPIEDSGPRASPDSSTPTAARRLASENGAMGEALAVASISRGLDT